MREKPNVHLFVANTRYDDFSRLIEEEKETSTNKEDGVVRWKIGTHKVKKGDICYFYYSNLPDLTSRIILKGIVVESDYPLKQTPLIYDNEKGLLGMKVKLRSIALEDKEKYSCKNLKEVYGFNEAYHFQGYVNLTENYQKLTTDLENDQSPRSKLTTINDYFNNGYCLCEFSNDKKRNHKTFIEKNGFYYIERHHLVERNQISKNIAKHPSIAATIENEQNIFNLCPTCHREIHHGKDSIKKEKIAYLYNKNKSYFDNNFTELKHGLATLEWLYEIYKIDL